MDTQPAPLDAEELARKPEFEEALHELVESGFGELHEQLPPPEATPAPQARMAGRP